VTALLLLDLAVAAAALAAAVSPLAGWEALAPLVACAAYGVARIWPAVAEVVERDCEGERPEPRGEGSMLRRDP